MSAVKNAIKSYLAFSACITCLCWRAAFMKRVVHHGRVEMKYYEEKNNCQSVLPAKSCLAICYL